MRWGPAFLLPEFRTEVSVISRSVTLPFVLLNFILFLLLQTVRLSNSFYIIFLSFSVLTVPSNFVIRNFISMFPCVKIINENIKQKLSQNRSQKSSPWACAFLYTSSCSLGFLTSYQIHKCWNKNRLGILQSNLTILMYVSCPTGVIWVKLAESIL